MQSVDIVGACCCPQVAEAAAQHSSHLSEASGKHEAAVYGTLAGHLNRILPVCHASADILWAYTRCWLESQVDQRLAESSDQGDLADGLRLGKDAVAATQRDHPEEVRRVVLDDVADFWPSSRYHTDSPCTWTFTRFLLQIGAVHFLEGSHLMLAAGTASKACAAVPSVHAVLPGLHCSHSKRWCRLGLLHWL